MKCAVLVLSGVITCYKRKNNINVPNKIASPWKPEDGGSRFILIALALDTSCP
jgi:hypothetical protein